MKGSAAPRVACERARMQIHGRATRLEHWEQQGAVTASRRSGDDNDGATENVGKPDPGGHNSRRLHLHTRAEQRGRVTLRVNRGCARVDSAVRCATKDAGDDASLSASNQHARATTGAATRLVCRDEGPHALLVQVTPARCYQQGAERSSGRVMATSRRSGVKDERR